MLLFCPTCANILTISSTSLDPSAAPSRNSFTCRTCPYQFPITKRYYDRQSLVRKEVSDILGSGDEFSNCSKTEAKCPNERCDGHEARYYQLQIRSADEPMTQFMKCTKCGKRWME